MKVIKTIPCNIYCVHYKCHKGRSLTRTGKRIVQMNTNEVHHIVKPAKCGHVVKHGLDCICKTRTGLDSTQKSVKHGLDSTQKSVKHGLDSTQKSVKHGLDSTKKSVKQGLENL